MTSQLEYIITEELLQRQHEVMSKTGRKKYEKEIRFRPYNPAIERDEMLGMQKKILEDMNLMGFVARREGIESISQYEAQNIVKQRIGELLRGVYHE